MNGLINSLSFQIVGVTIISSLLGIFVKWASRNDQHGGFKKEDLAIGLELCVTSLVLLITTTVNNYNKIKSVDATSNPNAVLQSSLQSAPWLILLSFIILWATSTVIRKAGWDSATDLNRTWGIIFPNSVGLLVLILTFTLIKG